MIRPFEESDTERTRQIHEANGLPENCFPDLSDPLLMLKLVVEEDGKPVMATFLRGVNEIYLLVDHSYGTPEQRWQQLKELKEHLAYEAWKLGFDQLTCWVPPEIDVSFSKRLEELGFRKSEWQSYSLNLK